MIAIDLTENIVLIIIKHLQMNQNLVLDNPVGIVMPLNKLTKLKQKKDLYSTSHKIFSNISSK